MMDGRENAAVRRGGLAARAMQGTRSTTKTRGGFDRGTVRNAGRKDDWAGRNPAEVPTSSVVSQPAPQHQNVHRFKQLAMIAAGAVAVAFVSLSYGVWTMASSQAAVEEATAGALPTLVSSADIRAGDVVDSSMVEAKSIPQSFRVTTALDGAALEAGDQTQGRRALVDIPAGTQITSGLLTGSDSGDHLAAELQAGMEAVTLSVDTETGLAGRVQAYDVVRVVSAESASSDASFLTTVCERARVVATGEGGGSGQESYTSVTVEVSPSEADAVREAQYAGRVSLVLVSSSDVLEGGTERG